MRMQYSVGVLRELGRDSVFLRQGGKPLEGWGRCHNSERPRLVVHGVEQAQIRAEIGRLGQLRFPLPPFPKRRVFDHQRASFSPSFWKYFRASIAPQTRHAAS